MVKLCGLLGSETVLEFARWYMDRSHERPVI